MAVTTTNLGVITAYGDAVAAGYTGTKAEWQTLMASYATVGQQAVDAKNDAVAAKNTAVSKATEATTAANTATTKASEASASAQSIAQSASQIAQNTSDISELKEDLTHAFPHDTVSGAVASFADGADDVPMDSVIVSIDPVQSGSGDPSPTNVRPISGWSEVNVNVCGVNVWNGTYKADKWINDPSTGVVAYAKGFNLTGYIPVVPGLTYYGRATGSSRATWFDANKNALGQCVHNKNSTFTVPTNARYVRFTLTDEYLDDFYINYPSTDHDYHPYSGQNINIQLGQTVYGGTLDVTKGELVIDRTMVDLGDLTWTYSTSKAVFASTAITTVVGRGTNIVCSMYKITDTLRESALESLDKIIGCNKSPALITGNFATGTIIVKDTTYTDATAFKTAVTGQTIVYELATPLAIQLTPHEVRSLLGSNNVWADTGDTAVEYRADPTLYISRLTEPDADMIADANITSGSYFMVGNTLYKATANIASGATISPDVNCTRKSLSEALNELNS